ncbi:DUF2017 family protein [Arcanobacterium pinnipediorum]|uniref:DUF2017 domain-containing protein n=1 Tax=Arcanobacterium pinnipediorum TaxID=1503041 RepID=A0ABY5AG03_9ACTO|nr:DUF2017 family protein [Arcanobacterium pinnipediorum]USR78868.1 DUF2017 domain-containing protein [Arcanobacterium pinnipediorum]
MRAFLAVRGGYEAQLDDEERAMIRGLASDVVIILGSHVDRELERRERIADDPFAAFEDQFDAIEKRIADDESETHPDFMPDLPVDDALERLLPDMSEDPELAAELRAITEESVAATKIDHLVSMYETLSSIPDGIVEVTITNEAAPAWLAAMNDIRMVLSMRLKISDDDDAARIYERAGIFTGTSSRDGSNLPPIETEEDMLAVLYAMVTWWQESLISAVRHKALRR